MNFRDVIGQIEGYKCKYWLSSKTFPSRILLLDIGLYAFEYANACNSLMSCRVRATPLDCCAVGREAYKIDMTNGLNFTKNPIFWNIVTMFFDRAYLFCAYFNLYKVDVCPNKSFSTWVTLCYAVIQGSTHSIPCFILYGLGNYTLRLPKT